MIKCHITNFNNSTRILIEGHSGYDVVGKDIVCSCVSTAMILTINLLEKMGIIHEFLSNEEQAIMNLFIEEHNKESLIIIENLCDLFHQLNYSYPKYFKIFNN